MKLDNENKYMKRENQGKTERKSVWCSNSFHCVSNERNHGLTTYAADIMQFKVIHFTRCTLQ